MSLLRTSIDMNGIPEGLRRMVEDDLPFTIARFLTMQAQTGQGAAQAGERRVFKLRNDWTTRNTKIAAATKKSLMSEVFTDTSNRKSGAPDYLPMQDDGGDKVPIAGHRYLAIPTKYLRKLAPGVLPAALRPRALLPEGVKIGVNYGGRFGRVGYAATLAPRTLLQHRALSAKEYIAFVQRTKEGTLCIFVRHGGIAHKGASHDAEPWYTLIDHAHIKARFPMEKLVQDAIDQSAEANFSRAAAEVMINNALKSGMQVKF